MGERMKTQADQFTIPRLDDYERIIFHNPCGNAVRSCHGNHPEVTRILRDARIKVAIIVIGCGVIGLSALSWLTAALLVIVILPLCGVIYYQDWLKARRERWIVHSEELARAAAEIRVFESEIWPQMRPEDGEEHEQPIKGRPSGHYFIKRNRRT